MFGDQKASGEAGEALAAAYLRNKGYTIRQTNWKYSYYEIDIIAQDGQTLVIAEVKTRGTDAFGYPEAAVKSGKKSKITTAAEAYIDLTEWTGEVRFDIVAVVKHGSGYEIHHIEDAFYPGL